MDKVGPLFAGTTPYIFSMYKSNSTLTKTLQQVAVNMAPLFIEGLKLYLQLSYARSSCGFIFNGIELHVHFVYVCIYVIQQ